MPTEHATRLLIAIALSVLLGAYTGWYMGPETTAFAWMGTLFLNALKMLIVPLVLVAVISGITAMGDIRKLGRLGTITVVYYFSTTAIAVLIGLLVVNWIEPGAGLNITPPELPQRILDKQNIGASDILLSLVSPNLFQSMANTQLLPVILFAIFFAAAVSTQPKTNPPVIQFFEGANDAMMRLVIWLMYLAPFGIFALVANRLGQAGGGPAFWLEIEAVFWHMVTVISGLAIHFFVLLGILMWVGRRGLDYLRSLARALLTAFGTASSSATLPLTLECIKESGVDKRSTRFVVPLGATINMDGTALYEAAAVLFIAQAYGIELDLGAQVLVFITATLAAIGAAGIPEAGLVTMVIVLNAVGLPLEGIGLLLAVDWLLDRFRTSINVRGDAVGAAVVARFLPKEDETA